jgi:hypothetical protein
MKSFFSISHSCVGEEDEEKDEKRGGGRRRQSIWIPRFSFTFLKQSQKGEREGWEGGEMGKDWFLYKQADGITDDERTKNHQSKLDKVK